MLYRENGQFKTSYRADQQIFPILQDRIVIVVLLAFAFVVVPLLASEYLFRAILIPFLILSLAALGLNILVGYCGQISLGTGAFMAVGAYAAYNFMVRIDGMPLLRGAAARRRCAPPSVGVLFGIPSLRIKGLYLAVATLAAQFFVDWAFLRIKWFTNDSSSGSVSACADSSVFGLPIETPAQKYLFCLAFVVRVRAAGARTWCAAHIGREWMAIARHGRGRRGDRHPAGVRQADGLRGELVHRRRGRRAVGLRLPGLVGAGGVLDRPLVPAAVHGHHRRPGLDHGQLLRRRLHRGAADRARTSCRRWLGIADIDTATVSHIEFMIFGALIVFFLIVEPHGLARLWSIGKEKLRLWPFPH